VKTDPAVKSTHNVVIYWRVSWKPAQLWNPLIISLFTGEFRENWPSCEIQS